LAKSNFRLSTIAYPVVKILPTPMAALLSDHAKFTLSLPLKRRIVWPARRIWQQLIPRI